MTNYLRKHVSGGVCCFGFAPFFKFIFPYHFFHLNRLQNCQQLFTRGSETRSLTADHRTCNDFLALTGICSKGQLTTSFAFVFSYFSSLSLKGNYQSKTTPSLYLIMQQKPCHVNDYRILRFMTAVVSATIILVTDEQDLTFLFRKVKRLKKWKHALFYILI